MQVVKAIYRKGDIHLLSPLPGIDEAELLVIVLDQKEETGVPATSFRSLPSHSEEDFKVLGMASFFDTDEDSQVNWEEVFDV